jgi:N-methylhydantoinase B
MGGGGAARAGEDGMDGIHVHITNTQNLPTEALENEFPLLVEHYALADGSGGPGRQRGGLAITRQIRVLMDGTIMSSRSDSHKQGAAGAAGGGEGGRGRLIRNPGRANEEVLPSKVAHIVLAAGESMRIDTPGGGGYGPPSERAPEALAADLRDDILTGDAARAHYGERLTSLALKLLQNNR